MCPRRAERWRPFGIASLILVLAGCHAGKKAGTLRPAEPAPYSAARPIYGPRAINPLFISGYAGRRPANPPARVVVPNTSVPAEPNLLP